MAAFRTTMSYKIWAEFNFVI